MIQTVQVPNRSCSSWVASTPCWTSCNAAEGCSWDRFNPNIFIRHLLGVYNNCVSFAIRSAMARIVLEDVIHMWYDPGYEIKAPRCCAWFGRGGGSKNDVDVVNIQLPRGPSVHFRCFSPDPQCLTQAYDRAFCRRNSWTARSPVRHYALPTKMC
jgi:hypothetical protein